VKLFVDTWGWVALEDGMDPQHKAAAKCYKDAAGAGRYIFTSDFVLDETFTLLFKRRPFEEASRFARGLLKSEFIAVEAVSPKHFQKAFDLRHTFRDKPGISFTDLTSMAIMQHHKITGVLTGDRHFVQVGLGFHLLP